MWCCSCYTAVSVGHVFSRTILGYHVRMARSAELTKGNHLSPHDPLTTVPLCGDIGPRSTSTCPAHHATAQVISKQLPQGIRHSSDRSRRYSAKGSIIREAAFSVVHPYLRIVSEICAQGHLRAVLQIEIGVSATIVACLQTSSVKM